MRITCFHGDHSNIGYIYLTPPITEYNDVHRDRNEISQYISEENLSLPLVTDLDLTSELVKMPIRVNTFRADYGKAYDTEYGNDMDKLGYITGIELSLSPTNSSEEPCLQSNSN
ncbi:hypothetical protein BSK67_28285 [Paenibacillus odorifer]|nr:hypothetical protein BSK67_28285 [Paenibacillus odorifer]